jgi:outer membrane protein TolC
MRRTTRLIAASLLASAPAGARAEPTDFAADRSPIIRVQASTPKTDTPKTGSPNTKGTSQPKVAGGKETSGTTGTGGPTGAPVDALFGPTYPIDLPTALRLAAVASPTIATAQVRVREALARVDQADTLWLPTLSGGFIYDRHDGITQRQDGTLLTVSRQSYFGGGGASVRVDLGEAYFQPLVARRLAAAEAATAQATALAALYDVASAYFDLVQAYAQLQVNAYILELDQQILTAAKAGERQGLLRSTADVNRAETEVSLRKLERLDLQARAGVASAQLIRLLVLDPLITLVPADRGVSPIDLFPPDVTLARLVDQAVANRPELAAAMAQIEAADIRTRQARLAPLIPRMQTTYLGGGFGGGQNGAHTNPDGRSDLDAQLFWELRGLGLGNLADVRLREAERDRSVLNAVLVRAQVASEVSETLRLTEYRRASLPESRRAIEQAQEMYRILSATSFGMIGPRREFDALEPLLAVQAQNQARLTYLAAVIEYNRSQFRLLTAVGQPPIGGLGPGFVNSACNP